MNSHLIPYISALVGGFSAYIYLRYFTKAPTYDGRRDSLDDYISKKMNYELANDLFAPCASVICMVFGICLSRMLSTQSLQWMR